MSIEAGVLVDLDGQPIYWHLPPDRSTVALPDSRELWDVIWENRERVLGFAHTHPGTGMPGPSWEDLTTFEAVERALGKRLVWWILSFDQFVELFWEGPGRYDYQPRTCIYPLTWAHQLREQSKTDFVPREQPKD